MPIRNRRQSSQQPPSQQAPQPAGSSGAPQAAQAIKTKKPVTKGSALAISIIVSFVLLLIFSIGLIFVAMMRTAGEEAQFAAMLEEAEKQVNEASINVSFTPAPSIREAALASNVNLEVSKEASGSGDSAEDPAALSGDAQKSLSYGAGVLVSQQGDTYYVLTNCHVVKDATEITATISDTDYKAEIVGLDEISDLAIVSLSAKDLSVAQIGSSDILATGDYTMSIGNPYGLNDSMTSGMISGLGRNMTYVDGTVTVMYANMIQTDSAINPGNSGGGLYNAQGELVGINTLVGGDESHSDNIGYAIPSSYAISIAKNLIAGQKPAHASFGLAMSNIPDDMVAKYGLGDNAGSLVNSVTPSGPAEIAGIVPNDIIVEYDGKPVESAQDMLYKIRASVINDTKEIKILREGKEMTLSIKVGSDA